ncbi:MAG: COX15/CtaA family protein, partial [Loktanella sp.]|nr:COX15/CtaA family protein [Loktanella sp.]
MATKNRSIFEEVGTTQKQVAAPGGIDRGGQGARGPIRIWLGIIFALVGVMILVGGLTRLTDSGLSITEWAPITGAKPPASEAEWAIAFEKYKAIPEYQLQNKGMSLAEFKGIFWWEWGLRQLGRVIGLVWAVGFFG